MENIRTTDKSVTIYTDSQTTVDSLQNSNIHTYLIEKIRRKETELKQAEWKIYFCWVKAHVRILGNELADTLAKDAATNLDIAECYSKVPKSVVKRELEDRSVDKWQRDWNRSTKDKITKDFSDGGRKTENGNNDHPQLHNHGYWTWEHKGIFVPF